MTPSDAGDCHTLCPATSPTARPDTPPLGLRVAWCEPDAASAQALALVLQRLGCDAQRCDDNPRLRAFMARRDAQGRRPWLVVAVDSAPGRALLAANSSWLDPDRLIRIGTASAVGSAADTTDSTDPTGARAQHNLVRPVVCSALASCFSRTAAAPPVLPASPPAALAPSAPPRGRVLVVEDDTINQTVIQAMLDYAGYDCLLASDGHSALALLQNTAVDLVLMDWQMPDMDGLEATRRLRRGAAGEAARQLPVVALTANAFAEDRAACLAAGMDDFLTKPVLAEQLVDTLARWIGGPEATPGPDAEASMAAAKPDSTTDSTTDEPAYEPSLLASLPMVADGSDPGFVAHLLAQFDQQAAQDISAAAQAVADGDLATLQRLVHTLKGTAGQVGALALASEAARQEATLRAGQPPEALAAQRLEQQLGAYRAALARHTHAAAAGAMSTAAATATA